METQINLSTRKQKLTSCEIRNWAKENNYTVNKFGINYEDGQVWGVRFSSEFVSGFNETKYFKSHLMMSEFIGKMNLKKQCVTTCDYEGIQRALRLDGNDVISIEIENQREIIKFTKRGNYFYLDNMSSF